jgi:hypothetical protein
MLADGMEVTGAQLDNGLLSIELVRPQIEPKVRTIRIDGNRAKRQARPIDVNDGDN